MKSSITIIVLFIVELGFSQLTMEKSGIDSGGGVSTAGTIEMVSTIGELVIQEYTSSPFHISEGFINPNILNSLGIYHYDVMMHVSLYPNPTTDFVQLDFDKMDTYQILLTDLNGKHLFQKTSYTNSFNINLLEYEQSAYILVVNSKTTQKLKTYKIIKQ